MDEFDQFWRAFPRRVGKIAARRAFLKAKRLEGVTIDELLAGVQRYIASKPEYADWCHPTTFLNQGRWMDEPDGPIKADVAEVDEPTYRAYLRTLGRHLVADEGPSHPAWSRRQAVPRAWLDEHRGIQHVDAGPAVVPIRAARS